AHPIRIRTRASGIQAKLCARRSARREPLQERNRMARSSKNDVRVRVHERIRHKVRGSQERPRLAVFRSLKHIYVQVIDDRRGHTLAAASSGEKKSAAGNGGNLAGAKEI